MVTFIVFVPFVSQELLNKERKSLLLNGEILDVIVKKYQDYQLDNDGNIIQVFPSVVKAAEAMGLQRQGIDLVCRKVPYRKTAGGYKWKYLD